MQRDTGGEFNNIKRRMLQGKQRFINMNDEIDENINTTLKVKKTIFQAGLFFFLLMILELPAARLVKTVQGMFPDDKSVLISILMTQGYLLLCAIVFILVTGRHVKKDLNMRSYKLSTFFLSLLILITASPMAAVLNLISQLFVSNDVSMAIFEVTKSVPPVAAVLIIGCLPGFIEELIYRGIMYSSFRKYSILTGAVVSALSFGLMHMNFNQIPYAIYLGLIFAFIVEATGSIFSTMILNMLFNAFNTAYLILLPKLFDWLEKMGQGTGMSMEDALNQQVTKEQISVSLSFWGPGAVLGTMLVILIIRKISEINGNSLTWSRICEKNFDENEENAVNVKPVNVFLILGWLFCIAISIAQALI